MRFEDKQEIEEYYVTLDCSDLFPSDIVTSVGITVVDVDDPEVDVTDSLCDTNATMIDGTDVHVYVRGGEDQKLYKFTFILQAVNNKREREVYLKVENL